MVVMVVLEGITPMVGLDRMAAWARMVDLGQWGMEDTVLMVWVGWAMAAVMVVLEVGCMGLTALDLYLVNSLMQMACPSPH